MISGTPMPLPCSCWACLINTPWSAWVILLPICSKPSISIHTRKSKNRPPSSSTASLKTFYRKRKNSVCNMELLRAEQIKKPFLKERLKKYLYRFIIRRNKDIIAFLITRPFFGYLSDRSSLFPFYLGKEAPVLLQYPAFALIRNGLC